jgi:hypothetical protein
MTQDNIKYLNELTQAEHNADSDTKRVMLYGWDADNLQAVRLAISPSGSVEAELAEYGLNDRIEVSATLQYIGKEKADGTWMFQKIDKSGVSQPSIRYARINNNPLVLSYVEALAQYDTLVYGTYSESITGIPVELWDYQLTGVFFPENLDTWLVYKSTLAGSNNAGFILTYVLVDDQYYEAFYSPADFSDEEGVTLEFTLSTDIDVDGDYNTEGCYVYVGDGTSFWSIIISADRVQLGIPDDNWLTDEYVYYELDATEFHTYRVTKKDGLITLFVDGVERLSANAIDVDTSGDVYVGYTFYAGTGTTTHRLDLLRWRKGI